MQINSSKSVKRRLRSLCSVSYFDEQQNECSHNTWRDIIPCSYCWNIIISDCSRKHFKYSSTVWRFTQRLRSLLPFMATVFGWSCFHSGEWRRETITQLLLLLFQIHFLHKSLSIVRYILLVSYICPIMVHVLNSVSWRIHVVIVVMRLSRICRHLMETLFRERVQVSRLSKLENASVTKA